MNSYYVYALIDPRTNLPFYIGKGRGNRCYDHLRETKETTCNIFKHRKIQSIMSKGLDVVVEKLQCDLDESTAYDIEKSLIQKYGRVNDGGILTNICIDARPPCSKGRKHSEESKQKMREVAKNRSPEQIEAMSNRLRRIAKERIGIPKSAEAIRKHSEKMMGHIVSEETRRKISVANSGPNPNKRKPKSEETKSKLSQSLKGNTNGRKDVSTETLDAIAALHKEGKSSRYIAEHLGIGRGVVRRRIEEIFLSS